MRPKSCERTGRGVTPPALGALLALSLCACATLTVSQERRLGAQTSQQLRRELVIMNDRTVGGYIQRMGDDILGAAGPQPFRFHFYVVEDDEINAFAAPAGHIYIHTETILEARNASELAGVMAHEIGHVVERHIAENYAKLQGTDLAYRALVTTASLFGFGGMASLGGGLAAMAMLNSFSRGAEHEADAFAVSVLPGAGYDPNGLVTFFETLEREGGAHPPALLASHPATSDRIANARAEIAELPPTPGLRVNDGGRLEIIQRRIRLLTRRRLPDSWR